MTQAFTVKNIEQVLPESAAQEVSVEQVFPGLTKGQRARLFSINLPVQLSDDELSQLVERLREEDGIEYAEFPTAHDERRFQVIRLTRRLFLNSVRCRVGC